MKPDPMLITKVLGDAGIDASLEEAPILGGHARIAADDAPAALRVLKECPRAYSFMVDLFGIDTGEHVDVVYHLRSFVQDEEIHLKAALPYGGTLHSVWEVHPAALMPERECAEMFGLRLAGHPNPKHLLLTEFVEPLLLKSIEIRTPEEARDR